MTKLCIGIACMAAMLMAGCDDGHGAAPISVGLSTPNDWYLDINADGSGKYGYFSAVGQPFPAGTIDFMEVVRSLEPTLHKRRTQPTDVAVSMWESGQTSTVARVTRDLRQVERLFDQARKATPAGPWFDELRNEKPPVASVPSR